LTLTPAQFEDMTVNLLSSLGYRDIRRTGGSGDLGADIVCRDLQGRSAIVQCKRYAPGASIGTPVIQTFIGMMQVHHRAERGLFVTTAGFSRPAIDLARQHAIALIDGEALLLLLHLTGTPVMQPAPREGNAHAYCTRCGTGNPGGDRVCRSCGTLLTRGQQS
jgi:restriction system protein